MKDIEAYEKGKLIKEALMIVNKLAESNLADIDGDFTIKDFDYEELQTLIIQARKIKSNRWWKLF
jgi:hypothetical protein